MLRLLIFFSFGMTVTATSVLAEGSKVEHVILVSVDGLAAGYLTDVRADMPNLRAIAKQGAIAEGMQTTFPSVTWPSHTSLATGSYPARHGVLGNSTWDRQTGKVVKYIGDPVLTKAEAIRVPTLYDIASKAGLSTASVIWPCSNGAMTLNWVIPDSNQQEQHTRYTTPGFADELAAAGIDISKLGEWGWSKQHSTIRDITYTQVTKHLLTQHNVNVILLHLITPDGVEHGYGPYTPPAYKAVNESDQRIGELWEALQQSPFAGKSALFVVSDHGFAHYEKLIHPNVVLKEMGLITTDENNKVTQRKAWCVDQGGSAFIYILDNENRADVIQAVTRKMKELEGVLAVLSPPEFVALGLPEPNSNPESPHLVLTTGPGYSFNGSLKKSAITDANGYKGTHGHDPRPDYMHATFVAAGAGIKAGTQLELVKNVDVAPTIAHLLGLKMEADGRVLKEILAP